MTPLVSDALLAAAKHQFPFSLWWIAAVVLLIVAVFLFIILVSFFQLWFQAYLTNARVGIFDLIGMKFRKVDYQMIVRQKIALVQAGVKVENRELEAHYLARGNVPKVATAVIAAHNAGIDLPWRIGAANALAGRDNIDARQTSESPKVIDCPEPTKRRTTLDDVD